MMNPRIRLSTLVVIVLVLMLIAAAVSYWYLKTRNSFDRGQALVDALQTVIDDRMIDEKVTDRAFVAKVIQSSYLEVRANASKWSGAYWGCTFVAALFSALAGLFLKLESFQIDEKRRKDIAATLAVTAAILVTISTSGDFQRKWQANRIAAAEIERIGYTFLRMDGTNPRSFLTHVGETLHRRHMAIVGDTDRENPAGQEQNPAGQH